MATKTREELIKEAREFQRGAKAASNGVTTASEAVPEKDPAEKGQTGIPNHPDGDNAKKTAIPEGGRPTNDTEVKDGVTEEGKTNPGPSGTDRKPTIDGDARDANFTTPTTPLDKIAGDIQGTIANILRFSQANGGAVAKSAAVELAEPAASQGEVLDQNPELGASMIKLAAALLSTERGMQVAEEYLAEYEGAQQARDLIEKAASDQAAYVQAVQDYQTSPEYAEQVFASEVGEIASIIKGASEGDLQRWTDSVDAHLANLADLHPDLHPFYKAGMHDAAMVVQAMMMGEEPSLPGGEGDLAPEQLAQLIAAAVEAGQIDPAVAEQLLAALVGGEGGELDEAGLEGDPAAVGEMSPEEAAMMEEAMAGMPAKAASARSLIASLHS